MTSLADFGTTKLLRSLRHATVWPSVRHNAQISAQAKTEDKKLRKDLTLEALALKVPFGTIYALADSPAAEVLL
jgi:hypothetical protein